MRRYFYVGVLAAALAVTSAFAAEKPAAGPQVVESGWSVRCPEGADRKKAPRSCEVFQRLQVQQSGMLVSELAVGFPKGRETARAAVILPLGVLLEKGIVMKVDEGRPVPVKVEYCTNGGCYAFMDIKNETLEEMKKGKAAHFLFKALGGQNVDLATSLSGFGKVLKEIM